MTQKEFIEFIKEFYRKNERTAEKKNSDYADKDPFQAFRMTEKLGNTTVEQGMIVRMGDKLSRIAVLTKKGDPSVENESLADSLEDLANYCAIFAAYLQSKPIDIPDTVVFDPNELQSQKEILRDEKEGGVDIYKGSKFINLGTEKIINDAEYVQFKGTESSAKMIDKKIGNLLEVEHKVIYCELGRALRIETPELGYFLESGGYVKLNYGDCSIEIFTEKEFNQLENRKDG